MYFIYLQHSLPLPQFIPLQQSLPLQQFLPLQQSFIEVYLINYIYIKLLIGNVNTHHYKLNKFYYYHYCFV